MGRVNKQSNEQSLAMATYPTAIPPLALPRIQPRLSKAERKQRGKALRKQVPRSSHGEWQPSPHRPDPIALIE